MGAYYQEEHSLLEDYDRQNKKSSSPRYSQVRKEISPEKRERKGMLLSWESRPQIEFLGRIAWEAFPLLLLQITLIIV